MYGYEARSAKIYKSRSKQQQAPKRHTTKSMQCKLKTLPRHFVLYSSLPKKASESTAKQNLRFSSCKCTFTAAAGGTQATYPSTHRLSETSNARDDAQLLVCDPEHQLPWTEPHPARE